MHVKQLINFATLLLIFVNCVNCQISFGQIKNVIENVGLVDLVQQTENLDCVFQCPTGLKKISKRNHVPVSNGCGSFGIDVDLSHLPSLETCCDNHDICYETCDRRRGDCDKEFYRCLNSACESSKRRRKNSDHVIISIDACKLTVEMIHQAVSTFGCKSYLDAQKTACTCENTSRKNHFEL